MRATAQTFLPILMAAALAACGGDPENNAVETQTETIEPTETAPSMQPGQIAYPETRAVDQSDVYRGVTVKDPYRWLENDVREDPEVAAWVMAQNAVSFSYLGALPGRDAIRMRMKELWDYEKFGLPKKRSGRYFFTSIDGLQNQAVLYAQEGLSEAPRLLIDPNGWSEDGATALDSYFPSEDGSLVAYLIQDGGSDWRTAKVLDVKTGAVLPDTIEWVKFSGLSWTKDGSGFFYSRYPAPKEGEAFQSLNVNQKVYFHRLGETQDQDRVVYERPQNPDHGFSAEVSDDGRYLVVTVWKGTDARYEVVLIDLENAEKPPLALVSGFESDYSYIGNDGPAFFFRTDTDAPKGRIVATDIGAPSPSWREIAPEGEGTLVSASLIGGRVIANYLEDVKSVVRVLEKDGVPVGNIPLPGLGSAGGFDGAADDPETFYAFDSFNAPGAIYRYDVSSGETSVFKQADTPFDPSAYEVSQVFYKSKDGTRVPMFIAHKKGLDLSAGAPTLLYGYGGFNAPLTPAFSVSRLAWMEMGGVYAVANIRGGGEYGKAWHDAGRLANKQNTFDDFIAAGEYLIAEGYTSKDKLTVFGGSNGGLLVGAVVNQRPDLFAAAIPAVGVMDMLRYNQFTAGRFWVDDYGDPAKEADFRTLFAYSPLHNIRAGMDYPAILVTTADTDDRVVPGHSFKYAAALQAAGAAVEPALAALAAHGAAEGRGARREVALSGGRRVTLIDESYNANPVSMAAAIALLGSAKPRGEGRRIAALGEMLELGPQGPALHAGLAEALVAAKTDRLYVAGRLMSHLWAAVPETMRARSADAASALVAPLLGELIDGDIVMVKGSNASRISEIARALAAPQDDGPAAKAAAQ